MTHFRSITVCLMVASSALASPSVFTMGLQTADHSNEVWLNPGDTAEVVVQITAGEPVLGSVTAELLASAPATFEVLNPHLLPAYASSFRHVALPVGRLDPRDGISLISNSPTGEPFASLDVFSFTLRALSSAGVGEYNLTTVNILAYEPPWVLVPTRVGTTGNQLTVHIVPEPASVLPLLAGIIFVIGHPSRV